MTIFKNHLDEFQDLMDNSVELNNFMHNLMKEHGIQDINVLYSYFLTTAIILKYDDIVDKIFSENRGNILGIFDTDTSVCCSPITATMSYKRIDVYKKILKYKEFLKQKNLTILINSNNKKIVMHCMELSSFSIDDIAKYGDYSYKKFYQDYFEDVFDQRDIDEFIQFINEYDDWWAHYY